MDERTSQRPGPARALAAVLDAHVKPLAEKKPAIPRAELEAQHKECEPIERAGIERLILAHLCGQYQGMDFSFMSAESHPGRLPVFAAFTRDANTCHVTSTKPGQCCTDQERTPWARLGLNANWHTRRDLHGRFNPCPDCYLCAELAFTGLIPAELKAKMKESEKDFDAVIYVVPTTPEEWAAGEIVEPQELMVVGVRKLPALPAKECFFLIASQGADANAKDPAPPVVETAKPEMAEAADDASDDLAQTTPEDPVEAADAAQAEAAPEPAKPRELSKSDIQLITDERCDLFDSISQTSGQDMTAEKAKEFRAKLTKLAEKAAGHADLERQLNLARLEVMIRTREQWHGEGSELPSAEIPG